MALAASVGMPAAAAAQTAPPPSCQFVLGFKVLHDLDPQDVGNCLDSQTFVSNGDAQQHTTKGLLVWRKADNWTAFTNGYMTWINGPSGLANRLNTDHFAWEAPAPPAAASPAPAPAAAGPPGANLAGGWRLANNQAVYTLSQDDDGSVTIMPLQVRMCTASGQSTVPPGTDVKSLKAPMNIVFTGLLSGTALSGNWLVCNIALQAWYPVPIQFGVSADGRHLSGQLQETLTFDRL